MENQDISNEQKKYLDFNNKRIQELETHFSHLKIEIDDDTIGEEDMSTLEKRNTSE